MKRADHRPRLIEPAEIAERMAAERADPRLHLAGRLVGERDRGDRVRRNSLLDQIRHPPGDDTRLAAAGRRDNQQRPVDVGRRLALGGRQVFRRCSWLTIRL